METHSAVHWLAPISPTVAGVLAGVAIAVFLAMRRAFGPPAAPARRRARSALRASILVILLVILANPVRVDESPGPVDRPKVVYLLDASRSMALGDRRSRWEEAIQVARHGNELLPPPLQPELSLYRFGEGLWAVDSLESPGPTDADTQLAGALRKLTGRFGRSPPKAVVLFSDGRAEDRPDLEEIARRYAAIQVPIHVVPLGTADRKGDVAMVGMVVPARARKHSQQTAQLLVRSYGYDGRRTELTLSALGEDGRPARQLNRLPIMLTSGLQSLRLTFQTGEKTMRIQASIPAQPDEVSTGNNAESAVVEIDRTKIRVLHIVGGRQGPMDSEALAAVLNEDPDIECRPIAMWPGSRGLGAGFATYGGFPDTLVQLFSFDAIVLDNVPRSAFDDRQLEWIEQWIGGRGAGLCMAGGPASFASGGWRGSPLEKMLPVTLEPVEQDWEPSPGTMLLPADAEAGHPIWALTSDAIENRSIPASLPPLIGANRLGALKPAASAIGLGKSESAAGKPATLLAVGPYGKGRSMALAAPIAGFWAARGGRYDPRYFGKFWRNVIYWLSETSSYGRRRLIASSDKILYRPGETVQLDAMTFDEAARQTNECKVTVTVEPRSSSMQTRSDYSPLCWPQEIKRTGADQGPLVAWSEELPMLRRTDRGGYQLKLPISESVSTVSASPAIRLEVSASEDATLIDSASIDVQVLDDPLELRNPMPDPQLMSRIASLSGGKVLADAPSLAAVLRELPSKQGPPRIEKTPLWSQWWLLTLLLALLSIEWFWRRWSGLA